ncbi:hypothetical protein LshimejAT787_0101190 [Lyophyllum shimeji]|uniref:Uncharacterized protein n=1 Tax=Lyophyllum shimeji TaxID=47721 RepID=A0A9P3UJE2_LYOSH|nr:hypothetical protein LshimejAT787_0101190 [Lyophyllum shimeji]
MGGIHESLGSPGWQRRAERALRRIANVWRSEHQLHERHPAGRNQSNRVPESAHVTWLLDTASRSHVSPHRTQPIQLTPKKQRRET